MRTENVMLLLVLVALVWWARRPAPAIATVTTASQWWDPITSTWRDF